MYKVKYTSKFKKDLRRVIKRGYDPSLLTAAIKLLSDTGTLPTAYKDHPLTGNWSKHRECHITPDWLLIYRVRNDVLVLTLTRTGTHSDLLDK